MREFNVWPEHHTQWNSVHGLLNGTKNNTGYSAQFTSIAVL